MPLLHTANMHESPGLHVRAMDNLKFIRETMERAGAFTAVPGIGMAVVGCTAVAAAFVAPGQPGAPGWLAVWVFEAALAVGISAVAIRRKAKASGMSLVSAPSRKFALAFAPPLIAGAVFTPALSAAGVPQLLPALWLLLYGAGVVTGGAFSVKIVPIMGLCFLVAGVAALLLPVAWANYVMAAGFGLLHIAFGARIAWRHGG